MKKLTYLLIFLILIPVALAYGVNILWNANVNEYNHQVYHCTDANCANVDNKVLDEHTETDSIRTDFNTEGHQYHALYFQKSCYVPKGLILESWGPIYTHRSLHFNQKFDCQSNINLFSNDVGRVNEEFPITVEVESAFHEGEGAEGTPEYVPEDLKDEFYSSESVVYLIIKDANGNTVYHSKKELNLYKDSKENVVFNWNPNIMGNYKITVSSDVVDCQCKTDLMQTINKDVSIIDDTTTTTTTTTTTIPGSTTTTTSTTTSTSTTVTTSTTTTTKKPSGGGGGSSLETQKTFYVKDVFIDGNLEAGSKINVKVSIDRKNALTVENVKLIAIVKNLNLYESKTFNLEEKQQTESIKIELPDDAKGQYSLKIIVKSNEHEDIAYKNFEVRSKEIRTVSLAGGGLITGATLGIVEDVEKDLFSPLLMLEMVAVIIVLVMLYMIIRL